LGGIKVAEAHAGIDYAAGKGRRPPIAHSPAWRANLCSQPVTRASSKMTSSEDSSAHTPVWPANLIQ
jgi:hypothetical protein